MAIAQDLTSSGGSQTTSSPTSATAFPVKIGAGRLQKVLVTTTTAQAVTFYDTTVAAGTSGATIVGVIPSGTTAGTMFSFNMPVSLGILMVGSAGAGQVTVSFN